MGIRTSADGDGAMRIGIEGSMMIYDAVELRDELLAALDQAREFDVDLQEVDEIDTAGVQLLLMAWNEAARTGRQIRLVAASEPVQEVLDRYGLWAFLGEAAPMQLSGE
jgi:anti-sigma B factor antagonist